MAGGIVSGRRLTVVDAQGWGLSEGTVPKKDKVELLRAMSLFGLGGPHVVLLVIPLLDFTESEGRAVERRMEVLTSTVWRHTMVLFTCGDRLERRGCSAKEHIQSGGPALHGLMEKCRYRYHVFKNKAVARRGNTTQELETGSMREEGVWRKKITKGTWWKNKGVEREDGEQEQVRELLIKVENMLQENGGWHFSLHMYQRMEEEWSRREGELRSRLVAETGEGRDRREQTAAGTGKAPERRQRSEMEVRERGFHLTTAKKEVNIWEGKEEEEEVEVSSEEEGYDSREESSETETGPAAPCWLNTSQGLGLNPFRGLA